MTEGAEKSVDELLAEAAAATEAAATTKRKREPKVDADGNPISGNARKPRAPKLDADGNPIVKEKKQREPKLDADGNPIPRAPRGTHTFLPSQTLHHTDKETKYREGTKRKEFFDKITDGITVEEYYTACGGKSVGHTYLVWYVTQDGSVEVR